MKIIQTGQAKTILSNSHSKFPYFAWPSVARLQNGKIAVTASGFRRRHICPFGKAVISFSDDDGESYTLPAPVIDTPLDDRDSGILAFGEQDVMVTSFNNRVQYQRSISGILNRKNHDDLDYAYLDIVSQEDEDIYYGSTFRISHDCGVSFEENIYKSPVTSPHGPCLLKDGSILWVGYDFSIAIVHTPTTMDREFICAYKILPDGSTELVGKIENVYDDDGEVFFFCEPHACVLNDGTIICHIRAEKKCGAKFTVFQSESKDGGKTWTKPHQILSRWGGSPPHIMQHSSGALISTYGYRKSPTAIKAAFSFDNGKTWDTDHVLYLNGLNDDLGYPSTVEREDGSLLTVFYAHAEKDGPAVIMQQCWKFER